MKHSTPYKIAMATVAALLLSGCSSLNSGLVTGDNQVVLAMNLESDTVIGNVTLPAAAGITAGLKTPVLTLRGTGVYVSGGDRRTYLLNINETAIVLSSAAPVSIPDDGVVLDTAAANPWMLVRSNPDTSAYALSVNNTLDLRIVVSSVAFADFIDQAVVCNDGETVLVRETARNRIRLFNLDRGGMLSDSGYALTFDALPIWLVCAPGATAGAVMFPGGTGASVVSFRIDPAAGLVVGDNVVSHAVASGAMGPINNAIAFAANASGLYLRSSSIVGDDQDGWIERFSFDPATAALGDTADFSVRAGVSYVSGRHQIGVNPAGERIYLPNAFIAGGRVDIFDAVTGANLGHFSHPEMPNPQEFIVNK
jgi:hypothetical protein